MQSSNANALNSIDEVFTFIRDNCSRDLLYNEQRFISTIADLAPRLVADRKLVANFLQCQGENYLQDARSEVDLLRLQRQIVRQMTDDLWIVESAAETITRKYIKHFCDETLIRELPEGFFADNTVSHVPVAPVYANNLLAEIDADVQELQDLCVRIERSILADRGDVPDLGKQFVRWYLTDHQFLDHDDYIKLCDLLTSHVFAPYRAAFWESVLDGITDIDSKIFPHEYAYGKLFGALDEYSKTNGDKALETAVVALKFISSFVKELTTADKDLYAPLLFRGCFEVVAVFDLPAEKTFPKVVRDALDIPLGVLDDFKTYTSYMVNKDFEGLANWSYERDYCTQAQATDLIQAAYVRSITKYMIPALSPAEYALTIYYFAKLALAPNSLASNEEKKNFRDLVGPRAPADLKAVYEQLGLDMSVFSKVQLKNDRKGLFPWSRR